MKKHFLTAASLFAFVIIPSQVFAIDFAALQTQVVNYLPYILIGGAAILLISIIGILLSKKKEDKSEIVLPQAITPIESATSTESVEQTTTSAPVNMDDISKNLYTPVEDKPAIQETMESTSTSEEQPITQPTFAQDQNTVPQQNQSSDLQDILQGEASASPMGPVTNQVEETPVTPVEPEVAQPTFVQPQESSTPVVEPVTPQVEEASVVPDLQQFINNQAAQVPPVVEPETPAPVQTPQENTSTPTTPGIV